jgi:hypothetical protein
MASRTTTLLKQVAAADARHLLCQHSMRKLRDMTPDDIYLAKLDSNLKRASWLLEQQEIRVRTIALSGLVSQHSQDLLENMRRSVELLHWQRALLLWHAREPSIDVRPLQPSPSGVAPSGILSLICAELKQLSSTDGASNDDVNRAIEAAMQRSMRRA